MGIIAAICIALVLSLIFSSGNKGNSFGSIIIFFLLLFMTILAGHFWITPFGPVYWGIAWMPLFLVGIISAFLLMIPPPLSRTRNLKVDIEEPTSALATISVFIWLLFLILLFAVILGFFR
jgi:hypothetical protein